MLTHLLNVKDRWKKRPTEKEPLGRKRRMVLETKAENLRTQTRLTMSNAIRRASKSEMKKKYTQFTNKDHERNYLWGVVADCHVLRKKMVMGNSKPEGTALNVMGSQ
jgi:hypothetical protein